MFSENLSIVLLQYCAEKRLSQERLAEKCGLSARYMGRIMCRHSRPTIETLEKICVSLHMTPNELLLSMAAEEQSYRTPMEVQRICVLPDGERETACPLCPRCQRVVEREYQAYCESCGQRLSWKTITRAARIAAGHIQEETMPQREQPQASQPAKGD